MRASRSLVMTSPCDNCPFLKQGGVQLRPGRAEEIFKNLDKGETFPCHKTVDYDRKKNRYKNAQQCAGATLLCFSLKLPNTWTQIAERLGFFDPKTMNYDAPTVRTEAEFYQATTQEK